MHFRDRTDAGKVLAEKLMHYRDQPNVLVLALPRGGVPVAIEVAKALHAPMDLFLVRKLGAPGQEELAIGAVATGGVRVLNHGIINHLKIRPEELEAITRVQLQELERRQQAYRGSRPLPDIRDHTVILVDDGLATGASMLAAVIALRAYEPARIVIGVPTSSLETCHQFRDEVDEIVCAMTPEPFRGVGMWYDDFSQLTDDDVRTMLGNVQSA